ncbi:MCA1, partial [Symbiodinium sp. KB8]
VTFLNMPERIAGHKTPAKCTDKDEWQVDRIGRPIATPTSVMLKRAIAVGHPHGGLLDPATALPPRPCEKAVPKIMHFLWFCSPVPERIVRRMMKFALMNPTWKVMILVDKPPEQSELELLNSPEVSSRPGGAIIVHYLASYADDFRNMDILRWIRNLSLDPKHLHVCAGMSDVARLEVMFKYGGIYMDTDFLPDRPFADYGDLFRWPFVTHKVCGINIINSILSFDKQSAFLDFALNAYRENCKTFRNCMPEGGAGPPFMAMAILRWNSSEIALIGQQFFHDSRSQIVSHLTENSWGQR